MYAAKFKNFPLQSSQKLLYLATQGQKHNQSEQDVQKQFTCY